MDWALYSKFYIALVSMVDPLAAVPVFLQLCGSWQRAQQKAMINQIAWVTVLILLIGFFAGEHILVLFGISEASFRVAGGIIILMLAFSMLTGASITPLSDDDTARSALAVVPLSLPLLAGPGAISTVIIYAHKGTGLLHYGLSALCIITLGLTVWLVLRSAPLIAQGLGVRGQLITSKVMGLIVTAIAVEFIANGLKGLFPILQ